MVGCCRTFAKLEQKMFDWQLCCVFYSLDMLMPTNGGRQHVQTMSPTMNTEEPGAGGMEMEELSTVRLMEENHRRPNNYGHCGK